jgi:hypothetical protein
MTIDERVTELEKCVLALQHELRQLSRLVNQLTTWPPDVADGAEVAAAGS